MGIHKFSMQRDELSRYLAPVLEVLEEGVQLLVRVPLQVAVDGDVPPVPDLL